MRSSWLLKLMLWAGACLFLLATPGFSFSQGPPIPNKVGGLLGLEELIARAEKEGWNLIAMPTAEYAQLSGGRDAEQRELYNLEQIRKWFREGKMPEDVVQGQEAHLSRPEQPVRRIGNVVWVGDPEPGRGTLGRPVSLPPPPPPPLDEGYLRDPATEATTSVGRALLASLSQEQMDLLVHNHIAEDVLGTYDFLLSSFGEPWPAERVQYMEVGGYLTGDKMSDFQRRLCGLTVCIRNRTFQPEWLAGARFAFLGSASRALARYEEGNRIHERRIVGYADTSRSGSGGSYEKGKSPTYGDGGEDVHVVVYYGPVHTSASLLYTYSSRGIAGIRLHIPGERFEGQALAQLVGWAKANLGPEFDSDERVGLPPPVFRHITDGPTKDVTTLLSPEEAWLSVEIPSDVIYSQRAIAAAFQTMGITVTGATRQSQSPMPPAVEGGPDRYTLYQLLNSILRYSSRNGYFVREGNTFRLVEEWEITGRYCLNPIPYLPAEGLDRPVTIAMKKGTLADFLQALREQTGLPLWAGSGAETCETAITALVKDVPAREIVEHLTDYVSGGWERLSDGKLALVPRYYFQVIDMMRFTTPEEVQQHFQKMTRLTLSLLLESLSPAHLRAVQERGLTYGDLSGAARELAVAAAQLAFGTSNPDKEAIAVKALGQEQDGSWQIRLWVGSAYQDFTTLAVPTIPPNPVPGWRWKQTPSRPSRRLVDTEGVY